MPYEEQGPIIAHIPFWQTGTVDSYISITMSDEEEVPDVEAAADGDEEKEEKTDDAAEEDATDLSNR